LTTYFTDDQLVIIFLTVLLLNFEQNFTGKSPAKPPARKQPKPPAAVLYFPDLAINHNCGFGFQP
jgi:hypothetical protein